MEALIFRNMNSKIPVIEYDSNQKKCRILQKGSKTDALYEYMQYGGMPLAVLSDEDAKKQYLKGLFETTYFKDAFILQEATRYDIRSKKKSAL